MQDTVNNYWMNNSGMYEKLIKMRAELEREKQRRADAKAAKSRKSQDQACLKDYDFIRKNDKGCRGKTWG